MDGWICSNAAICSFITLLFICIKLHQILFQFSTINLAQALGINIFERDYWNLKNPILSKDINLQYTKFIVDKRDNNWCNKEKDFFGTTIFKKISYLRFFFNLVVKESFVPKCTFSINFRSRMKFWHRIHLVDDYCQQFFKYLIIYFR